MKINGKQVEIIKKEHGHLDFVLYISIGKESALVSCLQIMLETLTDKSIFTFCNEEAPYFEWLDIYNKSKLE